MKNKSRIILLTACLGASIAAGAKIPQIPGMPDLNEIPFIQQIIQLVPGLNDALNSIPDLSQVPDWANQQLPELDGTVSAINNAGFDLTADNGVGDFISQALKNQPSLAQVMNEQQSDPNPPKKPMYERKNIYDTSSLRPVPHATFIGVDSLKDYQKCKSEKRSNCDGFTTRIPYSLDTETVRVGRDLRAAWQRLEDRSYWHSLIKLNNPAMLASHCITPFRA